MSLSTHARRVAAAAVTLAFAAGCGDHGPTSPASLSNPTRAAAQIERLDTVFWSPAYQSYSLALNFTPLAAGPVGRMNALLRAGPRLGRPGAAAQLRPELQLWSAASSEVVIPPEIRGKTFEWNQAGWGYVQTTRPGAPANGVRFILYALNDFGEPSQPLQEIGHADLIDQSASATDRVRVIVVLGGIPYVDYVATCMPSAAGATATVKGSITDGTHSLDVNGTLALAQNQLVADIAYDVNAEDLHARLKLDLAFSPTFTLTLDFRVQLGAELVTVSGTDRETEGGESGSLTVRVNEGQFAIITITGGEASYQRAVGKLTADERAVLDALVRSIGDIFTSFTDLLEPAGACIGSF